MTKKSFDLFCYLILLILIYQLFDKLNWWQPEYSSDYDTHWAYLAATTFNFIDEKWNFPNWFYGPWYYFFCSYIFGPIFFFLFYLNLITVHEAAMYSFLFGNFLLALLLFLGVIKVSKVLFKNIIGRFAYVGIIMFLPFTYKSFYNYGVENFAMALTPWIIYYLTQCYKKNLFSDWVKLSIIFSLTCSSKISFLLPLFCLIIGLIILNTILKRKNIIKLFVPILSALVFIFISYLITGSTIFNNTDIRNSERGFDNKNPPLSVFTEVDLIDAYNNPIKYKQSHSMINAWSLDFFGDYYNNFKTEQKHYNIDINLGNREVYEVNDKAVVINRNSLFLSIIFFSWYVLILLINFINLKFFSFKNFLNLFFFLIFFEAIGYCFFVFKSEYAQSLNLRYWGLYVFFLASTFGFYFDNIKKTNEIVINMTLLIFVIFCSFAQMYILI